VKGVVLAGGRGTRLGDSTRVVNKHLLPVYDAPMIYRPIATLHAMGVTDILIVTSPEAVGDMAQLLGSDFTYRVQEKPDGVAGALALAEGYVPKYQTFPVILGDQYYAEPQPMPNTPTVYVTPVDRPQDFGVYDEAGKRIVEKPTEDVGNTGVTGLYAFDDRVFDIIRGLAPSDRGELEISEVANWYLGHGELTVVPVSGTWCDMGTPDSLLRAALDVKAAA
jgi:glucose-1-phosphate thymidylyltransferase